MIFLATRIEIANLNCDSASAITLQQGSWVSAIGNVSGGKCAVTMVTGAFTSTPYCFATDNNTASTPVVVSAKATSPTAFDIDCADNAGTACTAYDVNVMCMGAH